MTGRFIFFILFAAPYLLHSQDPMAQRFGDAYALREGNRYPEALAAFEAILAESPTHVNSILMASWCNLRLGKIDRAAQYADLAIFIDPFYLGCHSIKAYTAYAKGDNVAGKKYLTSSIFLSPNEEELQFLNKDYDELIQAGVRTDVFRMVKVETEKMFPVRDRSYLKIGSAYNSAAQSLAEGNATRALTLLNQIRTQMTFPREFSYLRGLLLYNCGMMLSNYQYWNDALPFLEDAMPIMLSTPDLSTFSKVDVVARLASFYQSQFNSEKALSLLYPNLNTALSLPDVTIGEKEWYLDLVCQSEAETGKFKELQSHATTLLDIATKFSDRLYYSKACNYVAMTLAPSDEPSDRKLAMQYYDAAIKEALTGGYTELANTVKANYMILLYRQRDFARCYQYAREVVDYQVQAKDYEGAETTYNNLGVMAFHHKDYETAIKYLTQSIELVESFRNQYTGEQKLNFMARRTSAYKFLISILTEMKDPKRLFETQSLERARVLSELLQDGSSKKSVTLEEFQKTLKSDEAAIIYTRMEAGSAAINLITSASTYAVEQKVFEDFYNLKKKYLDRFNGNDKKPGYQPTTLVVNRGEHEFSVQLSEDDFNDMMLITRDLMSKSYEPYLAIRTDFLKAYYKLLIAPIHSRLAGVKKLLIMPDGVLNFLPFETLLMPDGKYLVEKFDIRYVQSPQVKMVIEARKHPARKRSLLAMGGAIYEQMSERGTPLASSDQLVALQNEAQKRIAQNQSMRDIYASLGFGKLDYLEGTLQEVKAISAIFGNNADVFTAEKMTENFIKSMSKSGTLKDYKVVHLATHGFAIPEIPELSGVAMCIPPTAQGGEDGYLTSAEISKLGMQADLAVLSACETGLGKIYGGEGVAGLTQALLVGGANSALVSLWPVSDAGTMNFMTGFYTLTEKENRAYEEAVNQMKRRFIAGEFGEEFKSPHIWAPFIHYGR